MSAETAMPILNRLARNLSPLEEGKSTHRGQKRLPTTDTSHQSLFTDGLNQVLDIGSVILTARSCGHLEGEDGGMVARGVNGEPLSVLTEDIQAFWRQGLALCVEVRGQTEVKGQGDPAAQEAPMLLLEKWNINIVSNRPSSPTLSSSPSLLLQAVRSYLHFSQIRSWQEVGVADHTHTPFRLLYRVCSRSDAGFSPHCPLSHTFPALPLNPHSALLVSLSYLPRLPCFPATLLTTDKMACRSTTSKIKSTQGSIQKSIGQSTNEDTSVDVVRHSPSSVEAFPFSPPLPSPLSPKLLTGLATDRPVFAAPLLATDQHVAMLGKKIRELTLDPDPVMDSDPVVIRASQRDGGGGGGGAVPPAACSPAPFSRMHTGRERGGAKRRSCAITCQRPASKAPPQRSNSAPVFVPSLCLLGTFEESVLNGRLEPVGHVEGFTVEVGASGTFCPPHIVLPVNAAFYSLQDNHGGTSPYLGQVDLSGVGKRGYQVPRKGTVQVTLFNPNYTVVKIYIVTYNFSDMPPLTQTFLRQKTLSNPTHPCGQGTTPTTYLPALHYLIHLRFLCSKSKRVYLHRDIRLIFARRAPDTDPDHSKVTLHTITEGPLEPKYSPYATPCSKHNSLPSKPGSTPSSNSS